ncbi:cytochrome P450 [Scopulibacillus darangshiensis]|uniref:Cytochrome P450 n=1 Tax=Scopulibacillus darangshiensis TaxID=442528 RepID=A0A4V2SN17_9BACL|nr:cytochrome P450 [Scopulibacillus darangshiensis]TCP29446.1 cytochrome P450 [Scopulibacillus darangshiensis]
MSDQITKHLESHVKLNLFDDHFNQNPYPTFSDLRKDEPVYQTIMPDGQQAWIITRYEDAALALKEPRFVKDPENAGHEIAADSPLNPKNNILAKHMLISDPPDHRRLRSLVQQAFTPRKIEGLRGRIEEITNDLLDGMEDKDQIDLIQSLAFPLPIIVICEMLGVPKEDHDKFRRWSNRIVETVNNAERAKEVKGDIEAFVGYLRDWIDKRRQDPREDMISDLILAEQEGDKLTEQELYSLVFLLLIAGHETTVNLIGNGVLALLQHPEQKRLLQNHPELIKNAIEELLRYDGPVMFSTSRWASEDIDFIGKTISKGDLVLIALDSANRDPEHFPEPDKLDLNREPNRHLAFGKGIHFCLGAPLARLEAELAINTLLRRVPNLALACKPDALTWRPGMLMRGLDKLPVTWRRFD